MIKISLLGSTGSIGRQVLNCVDRHSDKFEIVSLSAHSNVELFSRQIAKYKPKTASLTDASKLVSLTEIPQGTSVYSGENSLLHAISDECDIVVVAVMGFAGLKAVVEAIKMGKTVALANKEALVAGGSIVKELLSKYKKAKLLPVDSEHSAIFQSLGLDFNRSFKKLILTASGGAFRDKSLEELKFVKAEDALKHPNWAMGKKITVDCATMLNKGLEVIEAMWLFDAPLDKIEVVVHPESVIHSMVEYEDSSVVCQLAYPSMEIPIQLALSYPERLKTDVKSYNFFERPLTFKPVDHKKYPCFDMVLECAKKGGNLPCALSGANEVAVELFLQDKIGFLEIKDYIDYALQKTPVMAVSMDSLNYTDALSRELVLEKFRSAVK